MRNRPVLRFFAVLLAIASWLAISNHCALASYHAAQAEKGAHDCCAMENSPAQPPPAPAVVCCKNLHAADAPATAKAAAAPSKMLPREQLPSAILPLAAPRFQLLSQPLDTGPPPALSLIIIVRQQSLPAHAPPSLG